MTASGLPEDRTWEPRGLGRAPSPESHARASQAASGDIDGGGEARSGASMSGRGEWIQAQEQASCAVVRTSLVCGKACEVARARELADRDVEKHAWKQRGSWLRDGAVTRWHADETGTFSKARQHHKPISKLFLNRVNNWRGDYHRQPHDHEGHHHREDRGPAAGVLPRVQGCV